MFMIERYEDVPHHLSAVHAERLGHEPAAPHVDPIRCPVALFLIRDDGAGGSRLAREVVGSFEYWHPRTGHWLDLVFLGWGFDGVPCYGKGQFERCVKELEGQLNWTYRGESEMMLVDFVYSPHSRHGDLDFSETINLDLSQLLAEKKYRQLSPLLEELLVPLKNASVEGATDTWEISDYLAVLKARRYAWKQFVQKAGALIGLAKEVAPYRVRDLRRPG